MPVHQDTPEYSENTKKSQPLRVTTRHRALMRRLVAGIPLQDAAEELGYTVARASLIANSPMFKEEMRRMQEEINKEFVQTEGSKVQSDLVRARIKEEALASLQTIVELRDKAQSERVRQLSAIEILGMGGYTKSEKIEAEVTVSATEGLISAIQMAIEQSAASKDASGGANKKNEGKDEHTDS